MEHFNIIKIRDPGQYTPGHIRIEAENEQLAKDGIEALLKRYPKAGYGTVYTEPTKEAGTGLWVSSVTIWSCE